jgi:hypothetical protein
MGPSCSPHPKPPGPPKPGLNCGTALSPRTVIRPGLRLDVVTGELLPGRAVIIDAHRIADVVAAADAPAGGPALVDLPGHTVLPGLIAVPGDPVQDIRLLEEVASVVKDGAVLRPAPAARVRGWRDLPLWPEESWE